MVGSEAAMTTDTLTQVLTKLGARKDGPSYLMPDADVTLLVALEGETLGVSKVIRLDFEHQTLVASTARGEHYAFVAESVLAVKVDRSDGAKRERSAGFNK
jgi:hypothetical protein